MLKPYEILESLINKPDFDFNQECTLIKGFSELNEDEIGGTFKSCEFVIGDSTGHAKASGMLVKRLRTYDGIDTIQSTKICGQKADTIYALTNTSDEVYYFLVWYIVGQ